MFQEEFKKHITGFPTSPFLFIGSGMSRRYIDLETWQALLIQMVNKLKLPKQFEYYLSNAHSDLPEVATLMGNDFNDIWWTSSEFIESRDKYATEAKSKYSPIKFEICNYLSDKEKNLITAYEKEIKLFKKINIDGIITTNWDTLLESFFPEFNKFIGQEELIFSELFSIGEIYKIHGCSTKPESLILTSEDYEKYHDRNPYLAAKLLTIFMENPIIFMGYGLDDTNIQQILKSIIKCLTKDKIDTLKDRLIFCQWTEGLATPSITDSTLLISDTVIPIKLIKLSDYTEIFTVLANNKKKLPIKVLRQMKGMIYEFVKTADPKSKVYVSDNLEDLEDGHKVEFVYGVGLRERFSELGIKGIDTRDLFRDIITDNKWDASKVARLLLPRLPNSNYIPFFKYLNKSGYLNESGALDEDIDVIEFTPEFIKKVNAVELNTFYPPESYRRKKCEINAKYSSFSELKNDCEFFHVLMYAPILDIHKISVIELGNFLKANLDKLVESKYGTHYRKLICLYDFLKYKLKITSQNSLSQISIDSHNVMSL